MTAGIPEEQHPGFLLPDCRKCFLGEQRQLGSNANGAFPWQRGRKGSQPFVPQGRVGMGLGKLSRGRWLWDQVSFEGEHIFVRSFFSPECCKPA